MVSRGFSLIELMVTLAVLALLALAAMPFSGTWLDGQRQSQLRSALLEGIGQARALALRNPRCLRANNSDAAVLLIYSDGQLQLMQPEASDDNCTGDPILENANPYWQSSVVGGNPELVYGDEAETPFVCLGFDVRALPVPFASSSCLTPPDRRIAIKIGSQEPLYVDLR